MLKHTLVGALIVSSLSFAAPAFHPASAPVPPPPQDVAAHGPASERWRGGEVGLDGTRLLGEFESAAARRDALRMRQVDARFAAFIDQQLVDARAVASPGRFGRPGAPGAWRTVEALTSLERELGHLAGRVDRGAVAHKRSLYTQALAITQQQRRSDWRHG